jgi:hypothetical protein
LSEAVHGFALGVVEGADVVSSGMRQCAEGFRLISDGARAAAAFLGVNSEPSSKRRQPRQTPAPKPDVAFSEIDRAAARARLREFGHAPIGRRQ